MGCVVIRNHFQFLGHVGADGETSYTTNGTAVTKFSLAVTERRKRGDEWEDDTQWFRLTMFGMEGVSKYITKGRQVLVSGRVENRSWEGKDGSKKYSTEFIVGEIALVGKGGKAANQGGGKSNVEPVDEIGGDDIPF